ncbi:LysR family transcriptional regulator [Shewanella submarina]|uniref:LysR family transcriptional regulator n=1 Tax=Shewanella submarina TaxID=2016376 RepID=A0ABV7GBR9_9GAMM|nr:LysR family transcriptional regulator [Shewanella submarina]MCL1038944.1 LysR family transcriptional regulator [Shewanella submarina]
MLGKEIDIEKIDLLSLSILVLLYENKSATMTSKALRIPAPKISRCLKQLRDTFGNELFVRQRYGMHPNEFADQLYPIARNIIDTAKAFNRLDPNIIKSRQDYPIAIPDAISCTMMRSLINLVHDKEHPIGISLELWNGNSINEVLNGNLSFAVSCHYSLEQLQAYSDKLDVIPIKSMENLYVLSREGHSILDSDISFERIAEYPFVYTEFGKPEERASAFQRFCLGEGIPLHTEITIRNVASLIDYLLNSDALALTSYSSLYDKFSEIPTLHSCQLAHRETRRLLDKFPCSTLFLVRQKGIRDANLDWLVDRVISLIQANLN